MSMLPARNGPVSGCSDLAMARAGDAAEGVPARETPTAPERASRTVPFVALALVSGAIAAALFLTVLLLVSGWWDRIVQWLQLQVVQGFTVPV